MLKVALSKTFFSIFFVLPSLSCRIEECSGLPDYVYWYRDGKVINYSNRDTVQIRTVSPDAKPHLSSETKSHRRRVSHPRTVTASGEAVVRPSTSPKRGVRRRKRKRVLLASQLDIYNVLPSDAGTYTCDPSNAKNYSVVVHVVKGKCMQQCLSA